MSEVQGQVHKGLAGVVADETAISVIDPGSGSLLYRGYPVPDLAQRCRFEQVAYLLWHGELPGPSEVAGLNRAERAERRLSSVLGQVLGMLPTGAHPMDELRTAVSVIGAQASEPDHEGGGGNGSGGAASSDGPGALGDLGQAISLWSKLATVVAAGQRRRQGLPAVPPDPALSFSENFFHMCFEEVPAPEVVHGFEVSLTLYAEHGFNASTFAARVITSTLSDMWSAVTGAIGALKGPLHGGANEAVMSMFGPLQTPDQARRWVSEALASKSKIMGFGHRVYKSGDSRVPTMYATLEALAGQSQRGERILSVYKAIEEVMAQEKGLYPNLDFPAGPAFHLMGFDTPTFTPMFVMSRVVGWTAHIFEQRGQNALVRPLSAYTGPPRRQLPEGAALS